MMNDEVVFLISNIYGYHPWTIMIYVLIWTWDNCGIYAHGGISFLINWSCTSHIDFTS